MCIHDYGNNKQFVEAVDEHNPSEYMLGEAIIDTDSNGR